MPNHLSLVNNVYLYVFMDIKTTTTTTTKKNHIHQYNKVSWNGMKYSGSKWSYDAK